MVTKKGDSTYNVLEIIESLFRIIRMLVPWSLMRNSKTLKSVMFIPKSEYMVRILVMMIMIVTMVPFNS